MTFVHCALPYVLMKIFEKIFKKSQEKEEVQPQSNLELDLAQEVPNIMNLDNENQDFITHI